MNVKNLLSIAGIIIAYVILLIFSYKHIAAELNYEKSLDLVEHSDFANAEISAKKAIQYNPKEPRYFYNLAKIELLTNAPKEDVYRNIKTAIEINPKNLVTLRNVAAYFYYLALENLDNIESLNKTFDPKYRTLAKEFLMNLKKQYPNDVGVLILIAKNEKRLEFTKDYNETIQIISTLRQDILQWHPDLK